MKDEETFHPSSFILHPFKTMSSPIILLTGASSGIGAATAKQLAGEGYALVLAGRRAERLQQLCDEIRGHTPEAALLPVPTDVRDSAQIEHLVTQAIQTFGRVDVLVNNAGVGETHQAWQPTDAQIDNIMGTNFVAPMQLTRAVMPGMIARGSGSIINVASVASHISTPTSSLYCASKFALRAWNDALRREMHGMGIAVSLVSPGYIRTEMTAEVPLAMPGPEIVAKAISRLIRRPKREVFVPGYYRPLTWLAAISPPLTDAILRRMMAQRMQPE